MAIAQGVSKQLRFKRQTAKGTIAPGGTGGQVLRRNTSVFELVKDLYTTESEITSTQQLVSARHGVQQVNGKLNGIFTPGTYSDLFGGLVRRDYAAVTATTGAGLTIAGAGPTYTITRSAGSWLTDGLKVGMVVRLSVGALNAANINKNLLITAIGSATVMTVQPLNGVAMVAEGPITGCTITPPGKVTFVPITGHTNIYYTFEEWYPDVPAAEVSQDCQIAKATISMPGTGNATVDFEMIGLDQTRQAGVYFSSPTSETTFESLVAASGLLLVNGASVATITDASIVIDGKVAAADGVLGSNVKPDVFRGKVMVTGSFTAYFDSTATPALFFNETDTALVFALANGLGAAADFVTLSLYKLNLNSDTNEDQETGLKRTFNFTAEYNSAGGAGIATQQSTIQLQDSQAS